MLTLTQASPAPQATLHHDPFNQAVLEDGSAWLQFFRHNGAILLRFPGYADYLVGDAGDRVVCTPHPGVSAGTLEHLFLNQVTPLVLSRKGRLVLHACAVEIDGGAVAFVGPTGRGKSTLAAGFARLGHRFLADDVIALDSSDGAWQVAPGHASVRLWDDSREALLPNARLAAQYQPQYNEKGRLLAEGELAHCAQSRPLRAVYYLGEAEVEAVQIAPVGYAEAVLQLLKHSFLIDVEDKAALAAQFGHVTRLAGLPLHFTLDYPRRFGTLARLRVELLAHLNAQVQADPSPPPDPPAPAPPGGG